MLFLTTKAFEASKKFVWMQIFKISESQLETANILGFYVCFGA
jgi:hypothetical protein